MSIHWEEVYWGNSLGRIALALAILFIGIVFRAFLARWISRGVFSLLKKYFDDRISYNQLKDLTRKPLTYSISLISIFLSADQLVFPENLNLAPSGEFGLRMVLSKSYQCALGICLTWFLIRMVDFFGLILLHKTANDPKHDNQIIPFIRESLKILVVILSFFLLLGLIFHVDITSLIAGLGIGGLAIALAAKESIENLLGSFTIFFDKPFSAGDSIRSGNLEGDVEKIGFRSTRIRTADHTLVSIPNKKLVDSELSNLSLREKRLIKIDVNIDTETPINHIIEAIKEIKKELQNPDLFIENTDQHASIYDIRETGIHFRLTVYTKALEMTPYLQIRQSLHILVLEQFAKNNCPIQRNTAGIIR